MIDAFDAYQMALVDTSEQYPDRLTYAVLGIAGESGEVAETYKKAMRGIAPCDVPGDAEVRSKLVSELGDVLWYVAKAARELGVPLSQVARLNLEKIARRSARGKRDGDHVG